MTNETGEHRAYPPECKTSDAATATVRNDMPAAEQALPRPLRDRQAETPRGFDVREALHYESAVGHGFTLPGERDAWTTDVSSILRPVATDLPTTPRVLDIGAGTGKFTRLVRDVLRDRFGLEPAVDGVDASAHMLAKARDIDSDGITYALGDARELSATAPYDLVMSCQVLDSFEEPADVLAAWQELLKPGGQLLTVLAFSRPEGWTNRTPEELSRMPLARVTSIEPLLRAMSSAGYNDIRGGFLNTVSPLHGGAADGLEGPVGSRYYTIATRP